ncbi:MAG: DUF4391 domain-containing protein [Desulfobacteraceae bacterium]|nr:DUF4391 domain-containing protein [Desulfobacteraceae bacterium]
MIETLYEKMAIPDACHLGKRVFKKLFHENAKLGVTDKKAFREDIDVITWEYTLKPSTIPIQAYEDDQREYHEVAILQVALKTLNRTNRIAEIIHRAIPYPLVVVFTYKTTCTLSLAHKRFSQAEKGAIVAEDFIITGWIDLSVPTTVQQAFLDSLAVSDLPHTHFLAFYSAFADRLVALDCARLTGEYHLESAAAKRQVRQDRLTVCHEIEIQIAGHKAAIKNETQFNRQVELNMKIKELEKQLQAITGEL